MRLATLADGRAARVVEDGIVPLPGRLVDHLCRPPTSDRGRSLPPDTPLGPPIARPGKVVCLGLNYAAYESEIYRGALEAVPQGQLEAARLLGLSEPTFVLASKNAVAAQILVHAPLQVGSSAMTL